MKGTVRTTTVQGHTYKVWSDFCDRCTYAKSEDGTTKKISEGGYIHKDLTVRKEIAVRFGHSSFRK